MIYNVSMAIFNSKSLVNSRHTLESNCEMNYGNYGNMEMNYENVQVP